jgi:hypothetical protein
MTTSSSAPKGDPVSRAFVAYFRSEGASAEQPTNPPGIVEHDGKQYVVLDNIGGILAVYRILNSGALKRMKRWPAELEQS